MKIMLPFVTQSLEQTNVGDLVQFMGYGSNRSEIGIVLHHGDGETSVALLQAEAEAEPHFARVNSETDCVSYGPNWVIEISPTDIRSSSDLREATNVAAIAGDRVFFFFRGSPRTQLRAGYLDVGALQIKSLPTDAVFSKAWRLWTSDTERMREGGVPLLQGG
jgi:hypothetical protein